MLPASENSWQPEIDILEVLGHEPRTGIRQSRVAFVHPKATGSVLTEIVVMIGCGVAVLRRGDELSELAREYGFTDVDGSRPDCWRYMVEVQDPGRPADVTGYR